MALGLSLKDMGIAKIITLHVDFLELTFLGERVSFTGRCRGNVCLMFPRNKSMK